MPSERKSPLERSTARMARTGASPARTSWPPMRFSSPESTPAAVSPCVARSRRACAAGIRMAARPMRSMPRADLSRSTRMRRWASPRLRVSTPALRSSERSECSCSRCLRWLSASPLDFLRLASNSLRSLAVGASAAFTWRPSSAVRAFARSSAGPVRPSSAFSARNFLIEESFLSSAASSPRMPAKRSSSFLDPAATLSRAAEERSSALILIDALSSAMARSRYTLPVRRFVTWGNAFWLAWALWAIACQAGAGPFDGVEDWLSTLAASAWASLVLAALTLLLAGIALCFWAVISCGELE